MKKPRLAAIEYIRGISMMGVIGIHVGSQYLENPSANLHLVALFDVFTRFSVPIFFFISASVYFPEKHISTRERAGTPFALSGEKAPSPLRAAKTSTILPCL